MKTAKKGLFIVILMVVAGSVLAQPGTCQSFKSAQTMGLYPCPENQRSDTFDILKYTINADISDFVKDTIRCNTIVKFTPRMSGQTTVRFDLLKLFVDSIKLGGSKLTSTYNDTVIKVNLPMAYNIADTINLTIFYHGKPQGDPSGWGGFYFSGNYAFNLGVGFAAKPHNYGRVWFPCFDNFVEKSLFEFNITTDTVKSAYCNGQLMSDVKSGGKRTRRWVMNKEIPSYLASVAVADYTQVNWSAPLMLGTVPIILTARPADTTAMKNGFVNLKAALAGFENYYGPFVWNRVGYCLVPFSSGAMEHATNIAYPQAVAGSLAYEADIMAHELSHHWWGDLMTCETQEDMWLNEGMATYSQRLFKEWKYNRQQYMADVTTDHEFVLHCAHFKEGSYLPVSGVPFLYTYGDHVYKKGADMAHVLRTYMGDVAFFAGLKYVLSQKAYKNMNSAEFKTLLETSSGIPLGNFFNNWIFNGGWPHFSLDSVRYVPAGSGNYNATVAIKQKLTGTTTLYNGVPLEVSFFDSGWNRTIRSFTVSGAHQVFTASLPFNPVYAAINYDAKISDAIASEVRTIKSTGALTYTLARPQLTVTSVGSDSSLLRIEHNYTAPDPFKIPTNYKLSSQHYWKVDGILSPGFRAIARFNFDGKAVPSTVPATPGPYAYMDTCLASTISDSLVILYRRNAADEWHLPDKYTVTKYPGFGHNGYITVDTLRLGEYTFANRNWLNAVGIKPIDNKSETSLKIYPNPSAGSVTVRIENYQPAGSVVIEVRSIEGRVVLATALKNRETLLDCSSLARGTYIVQVVKQGRVVSKEKLLLQ